MRMQSGCAGFTLIELLVVVALVAILQSLAAPALAGFVNSTRLTTAVNSLFSSLLLARSEAIKRNSRAVVCKSSAAGDACIKTGGWEQGWIVFHDANNNTLLDAGEAVVSRMPALAPSLRFTGNDPLVNYVSFTPMGKTKYPSGAFQAGTLTVCQESAGSVDARLIVISSTGRPRTERTTVNRCPCLNNCP